MEALEQADKTLAFHRFVELPPELRVRVYEYYVAAFPARISNPTQPPVTRANRLLREECLPIFYTNARFAITMTGVGGRSRFNEDALNFMACLTAADCSLIRKLSFELSSVFVVRVTLCQDVSGNEVNVSERDYPSSLTAEARKPKVRTIKNEAESVLQTIVRREEKVMLNMDDIYAIRAAIERGVK